MNTKAIGVEHIKPKTPETRYLDTTAHNPPLGGFFTFEQPERFS